MSKMLLFVASEPSSLPSTKCGEEYNRLLDLKSRTRFGSQFEITYQDHLTTDKLIERVREFSPHYLHYCGHGNQDGEFMLIGDNDKIVPFRAEILARQLSRNARMECIILCNCYSAELLEAIKEVSDYLIGFEGTVRNEQMFSFVTDFYGELFQTGSVYESYLYVKNKAKAKIQSGGQIVFRTKLNHLMERAFTEQLTLTQVQALAKDQEIRISEDLLSALGDQIFSARGEYDSEFQKILISHPTPDELIWFSKSKGLLSGEIAQILYRRKEQEEIDDFAEELCLLFQAIESSLLYYPDVETMREDIASSVEGSEIPCSDFIAALDELSTKYFNYARNVDFDILIKKVLTEAKVILKECH